MIQAIVQGQSPRCLLFLRFLDPTRPGRCPAAGLSPTAAALVDRKPPGDLEARFVYR